MRPAALEVLEQILQAQLSSFSLSRISDLDSLILSLGDGKKYNRAGRFDLRAPQLAQVLLVQTRENTGGF